MSEPGNPAPIRALVVEDDPLGRDLLVALLEEQDYRVETASHGEEAWELLREPENRYDVVILDWIMPRMNGLELLERMQSDIRLQMLPAIFATGRTNREDMLRGIEAGAAYYVTKPIDRELLLSMVGTAVRDHARHSTAQDTLHRGIGAVETMRSGCFRFCTLEQAAGLATLVSRALPDPDAVVVGLSELLLNAVEHGNLGITYEEKSALLAGGDWLGEIERRLGLPEYAGKAAELRFERGRDEVHLVITDQGSGFDWEPYLTIAPDRVFHRHGRGIAMASRLSFDRLEYRPPGNQVLAVVELATDEPG